MWRSNPYIDSFLFINKWSELREEVHLWTHTGTLGFLRWCTSSSADILFWFWFYYPVLVPHSPVDLRLSMCVYDMYMPIEEQHKYDV